jgi:hypothetical protein
MEIAPEIAFSQMRSVVQRATPINGMSCPLTQQARIEY